MAKAVKIKPQTWRHVNRMLKEQAPARAITLPHTLGSNVIRVQNITGVDVVQFGILALAGPLIDPAVHFESFCQKIAFAGSIPYKNSVPSGKFAITCGPIKNGEIGLAWVSGICQVLIDVKNVNDTYADVINEDTAKLESCVFGPCVILWKEWGTGIRPAIVRFGGGGGDSVHKAFCKTDAPGSMVIMCYLDVNVTGTEIQVYCTGSPTNACTLNMCYPRLQAGMEIWVKYDPTDYWGPRWKALTLFQGAYQDCGGV